MNKTIIIGIVFLLAILAIYFLTYRNKSSQNTSTPPTSNSTAPQSTSGTSTINIQNFAFVPSVITISKGTTVTWTNQDTTDHQIKSNSFNSPVLSQNKTYSYKFNETGTYNYSCGIHPTMQGKIIVQ